MAGSNDETRRPPIEMRSSLRGRDRLAPRGRLEPNLAALETADNELLKALRSVGDDMLTEPTPQRLLDALRNKTPRSSTQ